MVKMPPTPIKKIINSELPFPPESPRVLQISQLSESLQHKISGLEIDSFTKKIENMKIQNQQLDLNEKLRSKGENVEKETSSEEEEVEYTPLQKVKSILQEIILNQQLTQKPEQEQESLKQILINMDKEVNICNENLCKLVIYLSNGGETKKIDELEDDLMKAIELLNTKRSELKESKSSLKDLQKKEQKIKLWS